MVVPQRRGRGGSEGIYDEGFEPDRSRYSCYPQLSLPGADRALRDVDAATEAILAMPFVDRRRVLVGGVSRGGILAVAYAGLRPDRVSGAINFVGGWMGEGCNIVGNAADTINRTLFRRGAASPHETLWFYGANDRFYGLPHSRANFAAFHAAGGKGTMHEYTLPGGLDGHGLSAFVDQWRGAIAGFLEQRSLPHQAIVDLDPFFASTGVAPTAFIGRWTGRWDGVLPTELVVTPGKEPDEVDAVYTFQGRSQPFTASLGSGYIDVGRIRFYFAPDQKLRGVLRTSSGDIGATVRLERTP